MLQVRKPNHLTEDELEAMAKALSDSGNYKIQRRLRPRPKIEAPPGADLKQALFVDVETTGPRASRILGMTREDVFPEREGPRTRVDRCGPAHDQPPPPIPR